MPAHKFRGGFSCLQQPQIRNTDIYLPNRNPRPEPKFNYKLAWFERLIAHAAELMASGAPVVLAGDYNVVRLRKTSIRLDHWITTR
jgi:exodeoxyribonuclease-3